VAGLVEARVGAVAHGERADREKQEENDQDGHACMIDELRY